MKFEDHSPPALPPQGANPCDDCALRKLEAFLPASAEELKTIESFRVGARRVPAGGAIVEEHRPSAQLFTLYSGWAFRYKTLSDGRRQILSFLLPGDFIGLQDEFAEGQTHGVEAATDTTLCAFSRDRASAFTRTPREKKPAASSRRRSHWCKVSPNTRTVTGIGPGSSRRTVSASRGD